jgi:hypothetical protein
MHRIDTGLPEQCRRPAWHPLVQQEPHDAFISTISSPIIAAA